MSSCLEVIDSDLSRDRLSCLKLLVTVTVTVTVTVLSCFRHNRIAEGPPHRTQQLYRTERLHPPGRPVTVVVLAAALF